MSNILASLTTASNSFQTYEQALQVVSNNTTNATTPGYVNQTVDLQANAFDVASGGGGVSMAGVISSRDQYAEYTVQTAQSAANYSSTLSSNLQSIESYFDLDTSSTGDAGVGGTINQLFSAFSNLTTTPNDASARQAVINGASQVASAFNTAYNGLGSAWSAAMSQTQSTATQINDLVSQVQQINLQKRRDGASAESDPGLDAQLYSNLESLSKLANITTQQASDGTTSIFVNGKALLVGTTQNQVQVSSVSGQIDLTLNDTGNTDITSSVTGGQMGALLQVANTLVPEYQGQLNTLAQGLASSVNAQLAAGVDQNGNPGTALFTYTAGSAAQTLALNPSITINQIAAASSTNPGGNDNALALSNLQNATTSSVSTVNTALAGLGGNTITQFYANLTTTVGNDAANAQNDETTQQQLLSQAQTLRSNASSVSLDEEAALMTQYQQAYDATSKLINVIDEMIQTALGLIPGTSS